MGAKKYYWPRGVKYINASLTVSLNLYRDARAEQDGGHYLVHYADNT